MNVEQFLNRVCNQIKYKPARSEISKELQTHIIDLRDDYMEEKHISSEEAEKMAILQMGSAKKIGKHFNKIHRPKLNWILLILIIFLLVFAYLIAFFKSKIIINPYIGKLIRTMQIALILSIIIYFFDYKKIKKFSMLMYVIASSIILLQFTDMSLTINGQKYITIGIGGTFFSPYIISIPLYIIAFIGFIINYKKENIKKIKSFNINLDLIKIYVLSLISILLMYLSNSLCNIIILVITYLIISTIKLYTNKKLKKISLLYLWTIISLLLIFNILPNNKFVEFRNNITQSEAIKEDILNHAKLIGETELEIFKNKETIIVEESNYTLLYLIGKTGIIISTILISIILLLSFSLIFSAKKVKEEYGKLLIIGLSTIFILEAIINILNNLISGFISNINLPFVTYGSIYLLINCVIFALILSIYRQKDIYMYKIDKCFRKEKYKNFTKILKKD